MPNYFALFIILATFNLGLAIIVEASLSFLGVGVPPNIATLGGMLATLVPRTSRRPPGWRFSRGSL